MSETPLGLSLDENDDGFVIRQKDDDGNIVSIHMSREDLFGLKALVDLWSSRLLQSLQERSGSLRAIVTHAVGSAALATDALQANVLLTLAAPTGERMVFALPRDVAEYVAQELPPLLPTLVGAQSRH